MLYALNNPDVAKICNSVSSADFTGAEMLFAVYLSDADVVARILPKPLKPTTEPLVIAFVAKYPQTNFGCVYNEGAILVQAALGNEKGVYCVSMPVDDDMAMIYGREIFGYPKKIAERIILDRADKKIVGTVRRKGVDILRIELEPKESMHHSELNGIWNPGVDQHGQPTCNGVSFLFKFFPSPDNKSFDYIPRLVRQTTQFKPRMDLVKGEGRVTIGASPYDPLIDIPVRSVVSSFYGTWDNSMQPGKVISRVWNVLGFLPHAFFKTDLAPTLLSVQRQ